MSIQDSDSDREVLEPGTGEGPAVAREEVAGQAPLDRLLMLHAAWRVLRIGLAAALVGVTAGWGIGRMRFGSSDAEALARIERSLDRQLAAQADALARMAADLAARRDVIAEARRTPAAAAALFEAIDRMIGSEEAGRTGVTIYDPLGTPIAWGGRTSDLPVARLDRAPALFILQDALGPRLVRIEAVAERERSLPARLATIAVEQRVGTGHPVPGVPDTFVVTSAIVPVSLRVRLGDAPPDGAYSFSIPSPGGGPLVDAEVSPADLAEARLRWAARVRGVAVLLLGLTLAVVAGVFLEARDRARLRRDVLTATAGAVLATGAALVLVGTAASALLEDAGSRRPVDLLAVSLAGLVVAWVALDTVERWRVARPRRRLLGDGPADLARAGGASAAAGLAVLALLWGYERVLGVIVSQSDFDLLQFSLHPLEAERVALTFALVLLHAAVLWTAVAVSRVPGLLRMRRTARARGAAVVGWLAGAVAPVALVSGRDASVPAGPLVAAVLAVGAGVVAVIRLRSRARRASQAARWWMLFVGLTVPSLAMYPSLVAFVAEAKERLVERDYGPETVGQRAEIQNVLYGALDEIDALPALADLFSGGPPSDPPSPRRAFLVWSQTDLNANRLTSAVELYGAAGRLISRFAFNLPEYAEAPQRDARCGRWEVVDEASPFGSTERHVLRASRAVCDGSARRGTIVVSVMLDYRTLPFIELQSPYLETLQPLRPPTPEGVFGRDVEFVAYGWSRAPIIYSGTSVWPLPDEVFRRAAASRAPFWAVVDREAVRYRVYFMNDRGGLYALGYPVITWLQHAINLAQLVLLSGAVYVLLLAGATGISALTSRAPASGRALVREVRASFYQKLFLAFVAAAVVPVLFLTYATHAYFAAQFTEEVKEAAAQTATVAQRLVEDYAALQKRVSIDDQIMVLIRRAIDQDVNLFERDELRATSALEVFASGLLPTRTPGDVYRRIVLDRLPTFVGEQRVGEFRYLLAAAPVRAEGREGVVTVPVTSRSQDAERQIDELDRRLLSAAVLFSLLGAALGYGMAQRIADPIGRLSRATRRIARGNLDARLAAWTSDELGRLIGDFNRMAEDLKRQRAELERTQRLQAWADMARQVAHDIKNPLTPIQLAAEHAARVNADRGRPLSPALDECTATILSQVRLLRQIAAEFSSFASTATPRREPVDVAGLIVEVVDPYRLGLTGRIDIDVAAPPDLPPVDADRTLLARAFTNIIENALHAMPGSGRLAISAAREADGLVSIAFTDTGVGMDADALRRIFEPYFSTKASGTGLGLTIAKRNVEVNGGTIAVTSERGAGTRVTIVLPAAMTGASGGRR